MIKLQNMQLTPDGLHDSNHLKMTIGIIIPCNMSDRQGLLRFLVAKRTKSSLTKHDIKERSVKKKL